MREEGVWCVCVCVGGGGGGGGGNLRFMHMGPELYYIP